MGIPEKSAVLALVAAAPQGRVSRWVTPDGDVVVVARALDGDFRESAMSCAGSVAHGKDSRAACACLYAWYEEHKE